MKGVPMFSSKMFLFIALKCCQAWWLPFQGSCPCDLVSGCNNQRPITEHCTWAMCYAPLEYPFFSPLMSLLDPEHPSMVALYHQLGHLDGTSPFRANDSSLLVRCMSRWGGNCGVLEHHKAPSPRGGEDSIIISYLQRCPCPLNNLEKQETRTKLDLSPWQ